MTPVHCRVKHDPENGKYGDCLRACIASLLSVERPEDVPHFADGNVGSDTAVRHIREWLKPQGLGFWVFAYDGVSRQELLDHFAEDNPEMHYMLFGRSHDGVEHVVICLGGKVEHDPSWTHCGVHQPTKHGFWVIGVIVKL